jgi:manganese/zinc/iron transport system substrate-binding protein
MEQISVKKGPLRRAKLTLSVLVLVIVAACSKVEGEASHLQRAKNGKEFNLSPRLG